eukprot:4573742-Amphidinium_carterae.1
MQTHGRDCLDGLGPCVCSRQSIPNIKAACLDLKCAASFEGSGAWDVVKDSSAQQPNVSAPFVRTSVKSAFPIIWCPTDNVFEVLELWLLEHQYQSVVAD